MFSLLLIRCFWSPDSIDDDLLQLLNRGDSPEKMKCRSKLRRDFHNLSIPYLWNGCLQG